MPKELAAYLAGKKYGQARAKQLNEAYQRLDAVYTSASPDAQKYEQKKQIIDELVRTMRLRERPNNATLIGFKLYQVGHDDFSNLYSACGFNWRRFLSAVSSLKTEDFAQAQRAEFGPVVDALAARGCPTRLFPIEPFTEPDRRWRSKQRRRLEAAHARDMRILQAAAAKERAPSE
jgi:predicted aminopeptidase